jgi:hypothetical protein
MRDFLIAASVCIAIVFAVDAIWLNGLIYDGVSRITSDLYRLIR